MKHRLYLIFFAIFITASSAIFVRAQTEGFDVKTPVENISDKTISFLNEILESSQDNSEQSIPIDLVCEARCYLIVPSINVNIVRKDFSGTGLLSCRSKDSGKFTAPLFYNVTNIESYEENGGGLIIFVTDNEGVKSVLGNQLHIHSGNSGGDKKGSQTDKKLAESFIAYSGRPGEGFDKFDLSGATLVYGTADTFNAYQETIVPTDILLYTMDIPPVLRGFNGSLEAWRKRCQK